MRDVFPEFYPPGRDVEKRFITTGTVVVDANVLLSLYRLSEAQRNETLTVFETIADRLWIPYQVGLEYQRNRLAVIREQAGYYDTLVKLPGIRDSARLRKELDGAQLPEEVKDEARTLLDDLAQSLQDAVAEYVIAAKAIRDKHIVTASQGLRDDPVRKRLDAIFKGKVGSVPDPAERWERIALATERRAKETPPGYKDDKGSDELNAGDYLLWAEILDHAAADFMKPHLLVTNDVKEDWYDKFTKGPRVELTREFHAQNGSGYHQVTLEGFLRLAKEYLSADVDEATIEKASELHQRAQWRVYDKSGYVVHELPVTDADHSRLYEPPTEVEQRLARALAEHVRSMSPEERERWAEQQRDTMRDFMRRMEHLRKHAEGGIDQPKASDDE